MKTAEIFHQKALNSLLIFIFSSRNYVFGAYEAEAFQYLVKPVDDENLTRVLKSAVLKIQPLFQDFILVNRERQTIKLYLEQIHYFEITGRKIHIHGTTVFLLIMGRLAIWRTVRGEILACLKKNRAIL